MDSVGCKMAPKNGDETPIQLRKAASSAKQNMESAVLKYAQREAEIMQLNKTNNEMQEQLKKLQSDYDALHVALRGHKNEKYAQERAADEKV